MNARRHLVLHFHSNITAYRVNVYDGDGQVRKEISTRQACLCICTRSPYLRIIASPLISGYSTTLYLWVDTTCKRVFSLYFNFPEASAPAPTAENRFTLTDATYGLPIDGSLLFTSG